MLLNSTTKESGVKAERTGWRDEDLSRRHREWGINCPAVDIDLLMLEYNHSKPTAVVEYKKENSPDINLQGHSYKAIKALCDRPPPVPFFVVRYTKDLLFFTVTAINEEAAKSIQGTVRLSEQQYVTFLYLLRCRMAPHEYFVILPRFPLCGSLA